MLRALVGLATAGGLIAMVYLGWSQSPLALRSAAERKPSWQLRELAFLKAAYDRTLQDKRRPAETSASLQAQQERIVRQMVETAKLLPADAVPAELHALLAKPKAASLTRSIAADGQQAGGVKTLSPDLRVGLRVVSVGGSLAVWRAGEFAIDPQLREPIADEGAAEREEQTSRRKPRGTARRSQP